MSTKFAMIGMACISLAGVLLIEDLDSRADRLEAASHAPPEVMLLARGCAGTTGDIYATEEDHLPACDEIIRLRD